MRLHSLLFCAIAPAAAQLSLPPALQSIGAALQSLVDPSNTPASTPAPAPTPTPKTPTKPAPSPIAAPTLQTTATSSSSLLQTSSTSSTTFITSSTSRTTTSSKSSTSTASHTSNTLAEAAATPTNTATSDSPGGLSQGAKVGIGVGIGVFVLVGLLAAALWSFVNDRHSSEAYEHWREKRRNKHSRLGSSTTTRSFRRGEKEMELSQVEYGNGTVLGGGRAARTPSPKPIYEMPDSSISSQSVDKDLPAPPVAYQQAKQINIKRKAVPGQAAAKTGKQRFSWRD